MSWKQLRGIRRGFRRAVKVSLGAADRLVNEGGAAREPNTARQGILLEEFTVGKAGDHEGLILDGIQRWLRNGNGRY